MSPDIQIAQRVYEAEKCNAEALGYDTMDVAMLSFGAFCGVLSLAYDPERPAVLTRFHAYPVVAYRP